MMERENSIDLAIALAVGVAAGIGATLLLRGGGRSRHPILATGRKETKRLLSELKPLRKQAGRHADDVRESVRDGVREGIRKVRSAVTG